MKRIFNFSAGPAILPVPVLEEASRGVLELQDSGMSILEVSHRGKDYEAIHFATKARLLRVLGLSPQEYTALFLGGGASLQFAMLHMNCPRCSSPLTETPVGGAQIDGCNGCGGVWFDNTELNSIARTQAAQLKALDELFTPNAKVQEHKSQMDCPKCHVPLFEFEFPHSPGIKLDACPQCKGIWMDDGELQAIYSRIVAMQPPKPHATPAPQTPAPAANLRQKARSASGFLSSIECPECHRPNPSVGFACWACGTRLSQQRVVLCPRCDIGLTGKTYFTVELDVCPTCCGIWLDKDELPTLVRRRPDELQLLEDEQRPTGTQTSANWDAQGSVLCPRCYVPMLEKPSTYQSGIRVDHCTKCDGVWVAHGKLRLISQHYYRTHPNVNPIG